MSYNESDSNPLKEVAKGAAEGAVNALLEKFSPQIKDWVQKFKIRTLLL